MFCLELDRGTRCSGGTFIGVRQGDLDAVEMDEGKFFSSIQIENRHDTFVWEFINSYDPVKAEKA
jgi:hypothetical protein